MMTSYVVSRDVMRQDFSFYIRDEDGGDDDVIDAFFVEVLGAWARFLFFCHDAM